MYPNRIVCVQQGFLIPLALVIIVGLSALALALGKIASLAGISAIQEGISAQAFYAAESGAQFGMNQLFFPNDTRAIVDANCLTFPLTRSFSVTGLNGCDVVVTCTPTTDAENLTSFFVLDSRATCGSGEMLAQRSIQVTSFVK